MFKLQKLSNYGTSTPAVARTLPQGSELLSFFTGTDAQKERCKGVLMELSRHLVRCVEICERVAGEIDQGLASIATDGLQFQSHGRVVTLPSVADLHSQAEAFLQSAKLAIRETARLAEPFYEVRHDHKFHRFAAWSQEKFGADDPFTKMIQDWEPWVKAIVSMRNAVDHPEDKPGGKLVVHNFRLIEPPNEVSVLEPMWGLSGGSESPIRADMASAIEGVTQLGESVLVGLFYKFKPPFPLVVIEIPEKDRDPNFPKRLRVGLASEAPA